MSEHTDIPGRVYQGIEGVCCASVDADREQPNIGLPIGAVAEPVCGTLAHCYISPF